MRIILCLIATALFVTIGCDKMQVLPKHYVVKFVGEGVRVESQSVMHGNYITEPENPEREGYCFGGWFTDNVTLANEWDFTTNIVMQDTTLYAKWEENTLSNYPVEIPFTEFSLAGTFCQWTNLNYEDKIIVINSNEKMTNHINCLEGNCPEIDFSKHTLLLVSGAIPNGIVEISNCLLQLSANEYKLAVEVLLNEAEMEGLWIAALIVNKLSEENDIEFVIILRH